MKQWVAFSAIWCIATGFAFGQVPGTCEPALGEAMLDVGNVRARILNNGGLFWRGSPAVYEVPKGEGESAVFTAGLWVGGMVADTLRMAGARYGSYEFWAGPLDGFANPPYDCSIYDRLTVLSSDDVERFNREQAAVSKQGNRQTPYRSPLDEWPWQWGAPVIDGDGDPTNYNLAGGDRPELLGDQTLWWVMNDVGNVHNATDTQPLGLEVRVSAFAFKALGAVGNSTFYRYRLHYRGQEPLEDAYIGLFLDTDLGNFDDDYIGSDTVLAMGYTYNADNNDEGHYGTAPPALGISFLRGPQALPDSIDNDQDGEIDEVGEQLRMTNVTYFNSSGNVQGDPVTGIEYYHYMQSKWKDGKPFTFGGDARSFSDEVTQFVFPGDPVTDSYWTEFNADGAGTANTPADRRFIVSAGPFRMEPGAVEELVVAFVWSRGDSNLDSVRKLRTDMAFIKGLTPTLLQPSLPATKVPTQRKFELGYHRNYPNPFRDQTTIGYSLDQPQHVLLEVYDLIGRRVETLVDSWQEAGSYDVLFDARGVSAGSYVYRLQIGHAIAHETMMIVR